jgi:hypothetical protein
MQRFRRHAVRAEAKRLVCTGQERPPGCLESPQEAVRRPCGPAWTALRQDAVDDRPQPVDERLRRGVGPKLAGRCRCCRVGPVSEPLASLSLATAASAFALVALGLLLLVSR